MTDGGMFSKLLASDKPQEKKEIKKEVSLSPIEENPKAQVTKQKKVEEDSKNYPKKQISAYLSIPQHTLFKQMYHKLNSTDANIDKSEIIGLSLEVLSTVLGDETPNFPSLSKLKAYLETKVSKQK